MVMREGRVMVMRECMMVMREGRGDGNEGR